MTGVLKQISKVHNVQDINGEIMFNNDLLMDSGHKTLRQSLPSFTK